MGVQWLKSIGCENQRVAGSRLTKVTVSLGKLLYPLTCTGSTKKDWN